MLEVRIQLDVKHYQKEFDLLLNVNLKWALFAHVCDGCALGIYENNADVQKMLNKWKKCINKMYIDGNTA